MPCDAPFIEALHPLCDAGEERGEGDQTHTGMQDGDWRSARAEAGTRGATRGWRELPMCSGRVQSRGARPWGAARLGPGRREGPGRRSVFPRSRAPAAVWTLVNARLTTVSPKIWIEVHRRLNSKVVDLRPLYNIHKRPTCVLINGLSRNVEQSSGFSWCRWIVKSAADQVFHHFPLQIYNATQEQSCVPQKIGQLLYWEILGCLGEIWRTRQ
jgi:hypothetical protein